MAVKRINLTGTPGQTYDLDSMNTTDTRSDSKRELVVQIWKWNPDLPADNLHSKPNPPFPVLGQMWLSKKVSKEEALAASNMTETEPEETTGETNGD